MSVSLPKYFMCVCLTLGIVGCQNSTPRTQSVTAGNVISNALYNPLPLRVLCRRIDRLNHSNRPYDVTLERQGNGTYNAYLNNIKDGNKVHFNSFAYRNIDYMVDWYHVSNLNFRRYLAFLGNFSSDFGFEFIAENNQVDLHSKFLSVFWNRPDDDGEKFYCETSDLLADKPPELNERLYAIGARKDAKTKHVDKVRQAFKVDALTRIDGKYSIVSLTNKFLQGPIQLNSPVYNKDYELVGYVRKYSEGGVLGVIVTSIHDERLKAELKRLNKETKWQPVSPNKVAFSQRFLDVMCNKVLTPYVRPEG